MPDNRDLMKSSAPSHAVSDGGEMRLRILGSAFQEFTANGYAGTTTSSIAARAKISKRDLYASFDNKQAMLIACIESRTAKMLVPEGLPPPHSREALASTLTTFASNILTESTHPAVVAMFRLAISEAERSPEVAEAIDAGRTANRRTLTEFLTHAQSGGLIVPGEPARMADRCLALVREDLMMKLLLGVLKRPPIPVIHRHASEAVALFLRHYETPAGGSPLGRTALGAAGRRA